jgi:hypothetical protein
VDAKVVDAVAVIPPAMEPSWAEIGEKGQYVTMHQTGCQIGCETAL